MAMTRQAILVLGMHRSGTSAVSGTLVRLGATGPAHLIPADENNAGGYWESAPLNRLHEDFLQQLGTAWHGWTSLGPEWSASLRAQTFCAECSRMLREEFQDSELFVVKDPRMCRTIPLWIQNLRQEGIKASAVLVLRNPMEVAQSLARRDGFSVERSLLVWLRNVLDAEHQSRAIPRSFVLYDDLVDDCRSVAERIAADLGIVWPLSPQVLDPELCAPIHLRHFTLPFERSDATVVYRWVSEAWASFQRLLEPRDPGHRMARETLDAIRTEFDKTTAFFGRAASEERQELVQRADSEREQLSAEIQILRNDAQAARAELEQAIERLNMERDRAMERVDQVQIALTIALRTQEELRSHANRTFNDLRASRAQLREATSAQNDLHQELLSTQRRVESLLSSISWRVTLPARRVVDALRRVVNPNGARSQAGTAKAGSAAPPSPASRATARRRR